MQFLLNDCDIKILKENAGYCIVSSHIVEDGNKVGYMYRENPSNESDSGWRFFSGKETKKFCNNPENFCLIEINTLLNYDIGVKSFLDLPINSVCYLDDFGKLKQEK